MNTEKAYRDLGEALVEAVIGNKYFPGTIETEILERPMGKGIAFYVNNCYVPTALWSFPELESVKEVTQHVKDRERKENLAKERKQKVSIWSLLRDLK